MQNNLRVFITNLGKYNEGELVGKWIDLPEYDEQEIVEALESIDVKNGTRYEEYFITDYELPFQIGEYANVFKLNDLLNDMKQSDLDFLNDPTMDKALSIAGDYDFDLYYDIVDADQIDDMIQGNDWYRIKVMLSEIHDSNAEYYMINNSTGNLKDITGEDEQDAIDQVIKDLLNEYR